MKITMTNEQAFSNMILLSGLNETGKLGYAIAKNRRKLSEELSEYMGIRDSLVKKYGEEDKANPSNYKFTNETAKQLQDELSEYDTLSCDVDIMKVAPCDVYDSSLTSQQLFGLDWMIDDEN